MDDRSDVKHIPVSPRAVFHQKDDVDLGRHRSLELLRRIHHEGLGVFPSKYFILFTFMHQGLSKMLSVRMKMKLVHFATMSSRRESSSLQKEDNDVVHVLDNSIQGLTDTQNPGSK